MWNIFVFCSKRAAMTRANTVKARIDERRYPVRVRVAVPPGGFGPRHAEMIRYLDRVCGREKWAEHPAYRTALPQNATFFYFADATLVTSFLEVFQLETVEVRETLAGGEGGVLLNRYGASPTKPA